MKQVLLTLGILLAAMLAFYWVSNRYQVKKETVPVINDREIFFEAPKDLTMGVESDFLLKARYKDGKIVNFNINFNYDVSAIKILKVEVNKDIFDDDRKASNKIDESFGKVMVAGGNTKNRDKLIEGEVILATIRVKSLKKGSTMIYSSRKAETGILEGTKIVEGNFQMPNFKVNFL